jgi:signal transduction histidine kinase
MIINKTTRSSVLFLILFTGAFRLAAHIIVEESNQVFGDKSDFLFFVGKSGSAGFTEVSDQSFQENFHPSKKKIPNYGLIDVPVWLKFEVLNNIPDNLYLEIRNADIDSISIYKTDGAGKLLDVAYYGDLISYNGRKIKNPYFYLDLGIDQGERFTYFVRFKSRASNVYLPLSVGSMKVFFERNGNYALIHGIYFGLILFIFIYHTFLFAILKRYEYLFFALFVASTGMLFAIVSGFVFQYLSGNWLWLKQYVGIIGALGGINIIAFTSSFLKTRINSPERHIWLLALAGVYVLAIVVNIYGATSIATKFIQYNTFFTLLFLGFIAYTSLNNGFNPAKYYLIAISFFVIGFIAYLLTDGGILGMNVLSGNSLEIGTTLAIITMSFALGRKINIYIDKRDEARALAIRTNLQNERLIAHHHQLLEARVTERTKDLEHSIHTLHKQREELKEANLFKDKVFSVISHDLKSPLSTLGGLLNVLKTDNLDENEKGKILTNVDLALKNTRNLLDNILVWANREHKIEVIDDAFDLNTTVDDVFSLFKLQAEAKAIRLVNSTPQKFNIFADENMLRLVLRNLISNAIKFTDRRGFVEVQVKDLSPDIRITVRDSGVGISEADQKKLFNNQNPYSTRGTDNEKGTGLGLLLCKEFVEKNGGDIEIRSKKKEGTSFIITLKNVVKSSVATHH